MADYTYIKSPVNVEQLADELRTAIPTAILITYDEAIPATGGIQYDAGTSTVTVSVNTPLSVPEQATATATVAAHVANPSYISIYLPVTGSGISQITFIGNSPTTSTKVWIKIPYPITITGWDITSDVIGSAVVDIKYATLSNYSTGGTSITASQKPTLVSQQRAVSTNINTWTRDLDIGYLFFSIDSISGINSVIVNLSIIK